MTNKDIFKDAFPQQRQIGGSHYKRFRIQPYEFISKNDFSRVTLLNMFVDIYTKMV